MSTTIPRNDNSPKNRYSTKKVISSSSLKCSSDLSYSTNFCASIYHYSFSIVCFPPSGVKPFACTEPNCLRRFTIRPDLNDHIRKCHTGERPYHCLICGKRFLTGSVFYQHRLIHRGERRYGCDDCGKRFYRADALKNHQRIHSGEKPFACTHCPKTFRQRGDRDKHIRARHSGPVSVNRVNDIRSRKVTALPPDGRIRSKKDLLLRGPPPSIKRVVPPGKPLDVVYVGNVAFPTSMFVPLVSDIDA